MPVEAEEAEMTAIVATRKDLTAAQLLAAAGRTKDARAARRMYEPE